MIKTAAGRGPASPQARWTAALLTGLMLVAILIAPAATAQPSPAQPADDAQAFQNSLAKLATASFSAKKRLVQQIGTSTWPSARDTLAALLAGDLYAEEGDSPAVFIVTKEGAAIRVIDPITGAETTRESMRGLKRVRTNNQLRKLLRPIIASYDLRAEDPGVRLAAVAAMRSSLDAESVELLRQRLTSESVGRVQQALAGAVALYDLESDDVAVRLAALDTLAGEVGSDVYNRVKRMLDTDDEGNPLEADPAVRAQAERTIAAIDTRRDFYRILETLFFGLSLGSVLVLAAIGLAITFGVMGVINMAHGELIMIGAYTSYVVQLLMPDHLNAAIFVAIPAAFIVSGLVGIGIERGVVRFLYGRPLETLLATFGISLILQQVVRSIFSPLNRQVATPEWLSGLLRINEVFAITYNRLYVLIFMFLVFGMLWLIMHRTSLGLKVRAVSQNRTMARALGVRSDRIDALTFGLGSGIAGMAGVALSLLTNVGPNMGQAYIIDSFMVVVFGGVGNLWGTLIGGMALGVANKLIEPATGAVIAKILMLIFIILFIQKRKQGLFPQKGRSAEGH